MLTKRKWILCILFLLILACVTFLSLFLSHGVHSFWNFLHVELSGTMILRDFESKAPVGETNCSVNITASDFFTQKSKDLFLGEITIDGYPAELSGIPHVFDKKYASRNAEDGLWYITYTQSGELEDADYEYKFVITPEEVMVYILQNGKTILEGTLNS